MNGRRSGSDTFYESPQMLRFLTYNIRYGIGADGRCDIARIAAEIRDADIIALQEVETHWDRTGNLNQPAELKAMLPAHYLAWGANVDVLKRSAGHRGCRRQFGNLILSRFPILSIRNHLLPKYGATELLDMQRGALETVIELPGGKPLRVYSTHFCHLSEQQRLIQARHLFDIHRRAPAEGPPIAGHVPGDATWDEDEPHPVPEYAVLMGDFNFQPDSEPYRVLAGDVSRRRVPVVRRGGFVDAWARMHLAGPSGETPAGYTRFDSREKKSGRRIDYCFVSEALAPAIRSATVLTEAEGSDHQPLLVTLADLA
jgi:endonuclease/exonuclease/phosphatase family metal-dependent hydrolase